jgi:hypothetical protein
MKYENFNQAKDLVEQIQKHQRNLDSLQEKPEVLIIFPSGSRIYTIGTESTCEHEYQKPAAHLVETIKTDLKNKIQNLKSMLELL